MAVKRKPAAKKPAAKKPAVKPPPKELPVVRFKDAAAFEKFLEQHHATGAGVLAELAKKDSGVPSMTYAEGVDLALCWGWIDGQSKGVDATWWRQKFVPRGKRSIWSKVNREKVAALVAAGRMKPSGLAAVDAAKADGRWDAAYDPPSRATVPDDLLAALAPFPKARAFFDSLTGSSRYAILFRLQTAKKPETRAKRLAEFVTMLREGRKFHA